MTATAKLAGQAGTDWRSDLVVTNVGDAATTVTIQAWLRDQANPAPAERTLRLAPMAGEVVEDVLGELFALPSGAAASMLIEAPAPLAIGSRTYNTTVDGTYGQSIPAAALTSAFGPGQPAFVTGLVEGPEARSNLGLVNISDDEITVQAEFFDTGGTALGSVQRRAAAILLGSSGFLVGVTQNDRFRSNLGLTNPLQSEVTVKLRLVDRTGTAVGEDQEIVLSGGEVVQIDRVSELLGVGVIDGGTLVVEPVSGSSVDAFLSIIDGRTGDPVFQVPTVR